MHRQLARFSMRRPSWAAAAVVLAALAAAPAAAQLAEAPRADVPQDATLSNAAHESPTALATSPERLDRAQVVHLYHTMYLASSYATTGWTGSVSGCNAGSTSASYRQAVVDSLNYYRRLSGLPGNVGLFTDAKATDAQNAALMFSANNALSHAPPTSWLCYTASGATGAGNSNIALGYNGGVDAMDGYMDDNGSGNGAVGHRRWILYPPLANVATGDIPSSGQRGANALWVLGPLGTRAPTPNGVAWPPQGYVPWDLMPGVSNRWSFSYPSANFSAAIATVTGPTGNAYAIGYESIATGYGDNARVFLPTGFNYARPATDVTYAVGVSGVTSGPAAFSYKVTVIDAEQIGDARAGDFDGDGRSDLLWHNARTGETAIWTMNGLAPAGGGAIMPGGVWRPTHVGDFNGDGRSDIVWRSNLGETALWLMNGMQILAGARLLAETDWRVAHVADFDGNGRADLLWRNEATGATVLWLMNGIGIVAGAQIHSDANWRVTHVADFNGDATADLVWRNDASGQTAIWLMNGLQLLAGAAIMSERNWRVVFATDLDGDNRADIVWRNDATGATAAWRMIGTSLVAGAALHNDANWRVVHTGDFNGDGRSDLVWRNRATGQTALWLMNGLSYSAAGALLGATEWQPALVGNFNGDVGPGGRPMSDLLWRNSRTGAHVAWLMNGTAISGGATVLNGADWWAAP
jgi:uncharacterized protein YkwD